MNKNKICTSKDSSKTPTKHSSVVSNRHGFDEMPILNRKNSMDTIPETLARPTLTETCKFKSAVTKVTTQLNVNEKMEAPLPPPLPSPKRKIDRATAGTNGLFKSFDKPNDDYKNICRQLENKDWDVVSAGLESMKRFINKHPEIIQNELQQICLKIRDLVTNARSQVTRAASQAARQLFFDFTKTPKQQLQLEKCSDSLVDALFLRCADSNHFICGDAERALEVMSQNFSISKVLNTISKRASKHRDVVVRTMAATLLLRLAERLGRERIYTLKSEHRDIFFIVSANLLREGNPKIRELAKNIFSLLSKNCNYKRLLTKIIPMEIYGQIEKHLKLIV